MGSARRQLAYWPRRPGWRPCAAVWGHARPAHKLLDQAVITDDTGAIVYKLPPQEMLALRLVARFGFAIAKPVSRNAPGGGFPFAVLNSA